MGVAAARGGALESADIGRGVRAARDALDEPIVHATGDGIEGGVRRVNGDARAHRVDGHSTLPSRAVKTIERLEEQRVVANDEIHAQLLGLGQHLGRDIDREQHAADGAAVTLDEQPDLVPRLGKMQRRDLAEGLDDFSKKKRHGRKSSANGGATMETLRLASGDRQHRRAQHTRIVVERAGKNLRLAKCVGKHIALEAAAYPRNIRLAQRLGHAAAEDDALDGKHGDDVGDGDAKKLGAAVDDLVRELVVLLQRPRQRRRSDRAHRARLVGLLGKKAVQRAFGVHGHKPLDGVDDAGARANVLNGHHAGLASGKQHDLTNLAGGVPRAAPELE